MGIAQKKTKQFEYYKDLFKKFNPNRRPKKMLHLKLKEYLEEKLGIMGYFNNLSAPKDQDVAKQVKFFEKKPRDMHKKQTVVLDLDETLIHCVDNLTKGYDVLLDVTDSNSGEKYPTGFNIRPHLQKFFEGISSRYEVIIYTASKQNYADTILNYIDPEGKYISHRLYREDCIELEPSLYTKDLRVIGGRELKNIVLVDNALYSFFFSMDNGIPIFPFYDDKKDLELLKLCAFLLNLPKDQPLNKLIPDYFNHDKLLTCQSVYQISEVYRPDAK